MLYIIVCVFLIGRDRTLGAIVTTTDGESFAYPADFVARVKETFPDEPELHEQLDSNQLRVGGFLDIRSRGVEAAHVLEIIDGSPEERDEWRPAVQRMATAHELFAEWREIMVAAGLRRPDA